MDKWTVNEEIQEQLFGRRYRGATLAKINVPAGSDEALAEFFERPKNTVVLYGPPGTGKTYIAAALVGHLWHTGYFIRYFTEREYLGRLRRGFNQYREYDYIQEVKEITDTHLFILDDLCATNAKEWREEVMMETMDVLYSRKVPTVLITNLTRDELKTQMSDRVSSRILANENLLIDFEYLKNYRNS